MLKNDDNKTLQIYENSAIHIEKNELQLWAKIGKIVDFM